MTRLNKVLTFVILLALCCKVQSQTSVYAGVWKNESKTRPYAYVELEERNYLGFSYSPIFGIGQNSLNKLSGTIGFDTKLGYGNVQPILGFGIEFFGYEKVYQDFMPTFRAGLRYKKIRLLSTVNWNFEDVETKFGVVKRPLSLLTYGLFIDLK